MAIYININDILQDEQKYHNIFTKYYEKVNDDYNNRKKSIIVKLDEKEHKMKLSKLLVNMILWKPFVTFKESLTEDFIFDTSTINVNTIASYLDKVIKKFIRTDNQLTLNFVLADIIKELGYFSLDFNPIIGNTISLYDKIQLARRNERYNELIHTSYEGTNLSTYDIEVDLKEKTKELIDILSTEDNCYKDYILSKEGINTNQLTQAEINIGPKPDLLGKVFPKIVDTNFLVDGMKLVSDYYINCNGGRKALIINSSQVKKAGYTMRKLAILTVNTLLDDEIEDCGSTNYINILMDSKETIDRYDKRFYVVKLKNGKTKLKCLDSETDYERVLGKTLKFRSSITCCCETGKICKTCYGKLSDINNDIHVGILGIEYLTSKLTQLLLSAKHLLKTNSTKLEWQELFLALFNVNSNIITLNTTEELENIDSYQIMINEEDIHDDEDGFDEDDDDVDGGDNLILISKYIENFTIIKKNKKGQDELYPMVSPTKLYLSPYFENFIRNKANKDEEEGNYYFSVKYLDEEESLFYIEIDNKELSVTLNNILKLVDNNEHLGCTTLDEITTKFISLLNESGFIISAIHVENIIRELVRSKDDKLHRPDFSQENPEYRFLRLTDANINKPSLLDGFAFEQIKKQLYDPITYTKNEPSLYDDLFR